LLNERQLETLERQKRAESHGSRLGRPWNLFHRSRVFAAAGIASMTWYRKFPTIFYLNDGRAIATLANARDLLLGLPEIQQANIHWRDAGALLIQAAYRHRQAEIADAHAQFSTALKAEGLM
jgi:hypothetical protein